MAGKFSGILLCSDFDGTLTSDGKTVSRENLEAIYRFEENGGLFTMASGRFPKHFSGIEGLILNTFAIALNGNVIYDLETDRLIWINTLEIKTVDEVLRFLISERGDWKELCVYSTDEELKYTRENKPDIFEFMCKVREKPVTKLIVIQSPQIGNQLREALEGAFRTLSFTQSWPAGLEMNTFTGGKGNAVKKLRELLGGREAIHTVVCAGDYENDISMIEYADIGYAVGNATDHVKNAADHITLTNHEHAIARIIEDLGRKFL